MLSYTGHPFVDIGIAAMTAFAERRQPEELTEADLEAVASYIEGQFVRPPLRGHLTMAFTSNGWFIQDAYNPEKPGLSADERRAREQTRRDWANRHLRQWRADAESSPTEQCVFTGLPAMATTLSGKLPAGRAGRAQFPLLQGDDAINFYAYGDSGLPVSGLALLALQFFPMGCAKAGVGLLAVHADRADLTFALVYQFWHRNQAAVLQAQASGEDKLPGSSRSLKTLLIEALIEAEGRRQRSGDEDAGVQPASITAYNFNNGKSPQLEIYQLPLEIVGFLQIARSLTYAQAWGRLVQRAWEQTPAKATKGKVQGPPPEPRRNYLYEDLFELVNQPDKLKRFVRTYFLRIPRRSSFEDDPRRGYRLRNETDLIAWPLVELFLERVVHMDQDRIRQIVELGDRLALHTRANGGKRFFRSFFTEQRPQSFRALLIKANIEHIKAGHPHLFDLHSYIEVFEEGDDVMRADWRFARDLVLMRMIDQLRDWLAANPEALPEDEPEQAATTTN